MENKYIFFKKASPESKYLFIVLFLIFNWDKLIKKSKLFVPTTK